MNDDGQSDRIEKLLDELVTQLRVTGERVTAMIDSGVEAGQARSLELLNSGIETALINLEPLGAAVAEGDRPTVQGSAQELTQHVTRDIARPQILSDLRDVVKEAEEDLGRRVGRHRNPVKEFIGNGKALEADIAGITSATDLLATEIEKWASQDSRKETDMAHNDENLKAIETAIQQLGKQLSFLSARGDRTSYDSASSGAGAFRTVTAQMAATLDELGMPHHGVQFSTASTLDRARDSLIEGLLAEFSESERNGNKVYTLGEGAPRVTGPEDGRLLAGAAKSAARRVRAEADNILDILDRLPDMNRFRTRRGVISVRDARKEVEDRFIDLDEVMADPYGVNIARAFFTLRRIVKALIDYFDYANLEAEFTAAMLDLNLPDLIPAELLPFEDEDELSKRRSPTLSEELEYEIKELVRSFGDLVGNVLAPLTNTRGNAAARLELSLTSAYGSARTLRDILVRTGTSLAEQDLLSFTTQVTATVRAVDLTVGQVMDWIIEVTEPFTGPTFRANLRERRSLAILAGELVTQGYALDSLIASAGDYGFSISLPGPMRQLEELKFLINTAETQASILAASSSAQTS